APWGSFQVTFHSKVTPQKLSPSDSDTSISTTQPYHEAIGATPFPIASRACAALAAIRTASPTKDSSLRDCRPIEVVNARIISVLRTLPQPNINSEHSLQFLY